MFSCRSAWSCAYSDAILFAGGVVAFPQVCRGALALHFTPAQLLLQLLGFGQLLPQSWTFIAHVTTQQAGHLHWDTQVFLICLRIPYMQSFHWHGWMDITLTQIDIICLIKGHNLLPILWQKKQQKTQIWIFNFRQFFRIQSRGTWHKEIPSIALFVILITNSNWILSHLHPLRWISAKDVLGRSLSSLQDLHNPQAVKVVNVCHSK